MDDFDTCIQDAKLVKVPYAGLKFSWHNSQQDIKTILEKLD
jgi:hypothetical protein